MSHSLKDIMIAQNALTKLQTLGLYDPLMETLYNEDDEILCVDCYHPDGEEDHLFTWYIPNTHNFDIEVGDLLTVEQTFGIGIGFAIASKEPYYKTREMHEQDVHPYCRVISNLGSSDTLLRANHY